MRRWWKWWLVVLGVAGLVLGCGLGERPPGPAQPTQTLSVYNWATYIAPQVLTDFEKKFNVRIKYDTFDSPDTLYAKLKPGNPGYDVIFPSDYMVNRMIQEQMLIPLALDKLPNRVHLGKRFQNLPYDPGGRYSVPYLWGTQGIGYNRRQTGKVIDSWQAMFDPQYRVAWQEESRATLGAVLIALGLNPNTTDPAEINRARDWLIQHRGNVVAFAPDTGEELLNQGEVTLAFENSGDVFQVMAQNPDIAYAIPKEGAILWVDAMAIPKGAPHVELAHAFINYLLDPEVAAQIANYTHYATPNQTAIDRRLIQVKDLQNPGIYPPPDVLNRLRVLENLPPAALQRYEAAWNEIKLRVGRG
ncbi:MAG: spermidine/putrescine ABC transporter substrate-binding protein [Gloeomargarita sp. SKYBB_i_bin120]|nr:spermidine/putrescine ABC transporter substrate-binding protein [Gloeomargarita sp. SKYG98]MCS7292271.1 spermidine/putrescine ABC transporter substrate-binding protein [Gloeomargarita sp. SKYB120]MDW8177832.1 spermidine/putrescine ABC transporter substrate-binding protein [Gloeomargarita sp. SKYBB_i_bin120]